MILEGIFNMIKFIVLSVINLFPALPDTTFLIQNFEPLFKALSNINSFVSVPLLSKCLVTLLLFMNIEFLWSCIMWVVRKIPFVE